MRNITQHKNEIESLGEPDLVNLINTSFSRKMNPKQKTLDLLMDYASIAVLKKNKIQYQFHLN